MLSHLAVLQVVVPLLAAPTCLILERARAAWLFACLACLLSLGISIALFMQVQASGPISYALGGWEAPWGIEYRIDALSSFVLLLINLVAAAVIIGANSSLTAELPEPRHSPFYVLFLLCFAGLQGIVATGDAFNVFVFLEISSLATYALVALGRDRRALFAAYQYLIVGTIGATFYLIGIGFLYSLTGTLNMADMAQLLPGLEEQRLVAAAFAFIVIGIAMKLALFPLHGWLPDAYSQAPSMATAFLAASATKVALYLFIRMYFEVLGPEAVNALFPVGKLFLLLGAIAVILASLAAIRQNNVKRVFALSSVGQIGYLVIGVGLGNALGLQAALLHLFNHGLIKAALFIAVAAVVCRVGGSRLEDFRGLGRAMPWTMGGMVIGALSLIGVPLTAGFVSKWFLVLAAMEAGLWLLVALVLIGSFIALFYVWRIVEVAYFQTRDGAAVSEAPLMLLIPLWAMALANLYFGIDTSLTVGGSEQAVNFLMGSRP